MLLCIASLRIKHSASNKEINDSVTSLARNSVVYNLQRNTQHGARLPACSTAWQASNAQRARQRAERSVLDMLDSEHGEQGRSPLVYRSSKHDSLMDRVQLILSLDLLLRLPKLQTLVTK